MSEQKTPWKKLQNKDYLGEYDFLPGEEKTVTIASITTGEVIGDGGKKSSKPIIYFSEPVKPLIANTTNFKRLQKLFGSPYVEDWIGRQVTLYGDPTVTFGKEVVGGVRIRSKLPADLCCSDCGQIIQASGKLSAQQISSGTLNKFGRALCLDCANQAKAGQGQEIKA
ncbi:MAG: hypothetical protein AB9880_00105 [Christensenellales bacterium]